MNFSDTSQSGTTAHGRCGIVVPTAGKDDGKISEDNNLITFLLVINIITCPFTIILNVLAILAVKMKARLKNKANITLGCLAVTDVLTGVIGQPSSIATTVISLRPETALHRHCMMLNQLSVNVMRLLSGASLAHMALINVGRYFAIKHPFAYTTKVTKARILCSCALAWLTMLLLNAPLILTTVRAFYAINSIVWFALVAVIIFCQVVLYLEIRRHEKHIAQHQVSEEARQNFLKEKKAFKLTTIVLLALLLTYLPMTPFRILVVNFGIATLNGLHIAACLMLLNSLMNPVIYCVKRRSFRVVFIEILLRKTYAQAQNIERQVCKFRNAVAPLEEERQA